MHCTLQQKMSFTNYIFTNVGEFDVMESVRLLITFNYVVKTYKENIVKKTC